MTGRPEVSGGADVKLERVSVGTAEKEALAGTALRAGLGEALAVFARFAMLFWVGSWAALVLFAIAFGASSVSSAALRFLDVLGLTEVPLTTGTSFRGARVRAEDRGGIVVFTGDALC